MAHGPLKGKHPAIRWEERDKNWKGDFWPVFKPPGTPQPRAPLPLQAPPHRPYPTPPQQTPPHLFGCL